MHVVTGNGGYAMRITITTVEELDKFMEGHPECHLYLGTRPLTRELTIYNDKDYQNHTLYLFDTDKEVVSMSDISFGRIKCAAEVKIGQR